MYGHPEAVRHESGGSPEDAIHFFANFDVFVNRCISVKTSLINTKLGNLVNLGVLFLTMWIKSIVAYPNPLIYRLVPSPSRVEIRQ